MKKITCSKTDSQWARLCAPFFGISLRTSTASLILRHGLVFALALSEIILSSPALAQSEAPKCAQVFQEQKLLITDRVAKNQFVTNRHLEDYARELHPDFKNSITKLSANQHWVDLGAGKALAQIDYIKSFDKNTDAAFVSAVAFKLDRWFSPKSYNGKLQVHEGAFESQPTHTWKKADVVTDVYGVLSYTGNLSVSLQKTIDMMNTGGELYLLMTPYGTSVRSGETNIPFFDFVKSIPGLKIEGTASQVKITKTAETVIIPPLQLVRYKDEAPPLRLFQLNFKEN
ncbi:hypothetical protein [Bdellovibrio sp. HCB209]|uniref:hypothetical protein n=1 Tax=Bdellovibrio sp. HCB209 TaxID=3394354 RepID=UPI0039B4C9B5